MTVKASAGDTVEYKWETAPDGVLTGILVSGDHKAWVDIRTKTAVFKIPREDIVRNISAEHRERMNQPPKTLTVGLLKKLLGSFEEDMEIEIEGCDCTGVAKGVDIMDDGKLLITRV
jgi:hypothetical protein